MRRRRLLICLGDMMKGYYVPQSKLFVLEVESLEVASWTPGQPGQDIRAVETDKLTDQDFQALGYRDRADYMADWGEVFGGRVWLMKIRRL